MINFFKNCLYLSLFFLRLTKYICTNGVSHLKLQNIYSQKEINIIGNAPNSGFNFSDFTEDSINIMVNFSYKTNEFKRIKPKYLCLIDPIFYEKTEIQDELLLALSKIEWDLEIVSLAHYSKNKLFPKLEKNNIKANYIRCIESTGISNNSILRFIYSHNFGVPVFQNVAIAATYFAIQTGAKKINLCNVKLDMYTKTIVDKENNIFLIDEHYYKTVMRKVNDFDMHSWLLAFSKMFLGFKQISKYAKQLNVTIVNKTEDSHIDVFEK